LWEPEKKTTKLYILGVAIALTLGIHYGWLVEPFFGHIHWLHAIHGRFCYIPIVIAAAWFGLRGGLLTAFLISLLILPYILGSDLPTEELASEYAEIVFYFAIALLAGGLIDREFRARQRAENMRLQLERSQKMSLVGQIAAGMAHEIKNPLASIKGAVEILCEDSTTATDKDEFKSIVLKEVKRINGSLTDFLEFARPGETQMSVLNLAEVIRSSLRQVQAQAQKQNISIVSHVEDPVMVEADQDKIHQVMLNLLLNAIDASSDGTSVTVSLQRDSQAGRAVVSVEDTGAGITEEHKSRVFEPFFTTKSSGTGLGLAIAANIVQKHNGFITLDNRPDRGAVARIILPLLPVEVTA
jgi:two-component system sensor histidine kinase HydH